MKKLLILVVLSPITAFAEALPLDDALRATYTACAGIDKSMANLKMMAGINTAVTAVGTGLGAGAFGVGIAKSQKDNDAQTKSNEIKNSREADLYTQLYLESKGIMLPDQEEMDEWLAEFRNTQWDKEVGELRETSKKLGDWRTGLMAGGAATSITGAVLAGVNRVDNDLQGQIDNCRATVKMLKESISVARAEGVDVTEAVSIANACGEFEYVDISKINKRAKGAMISSAVGAATGVAGTVTSGVANSDKIRQDDKRIGKTDEAWQKEKNLNTAANVLAGTTAVASATATVFNATQISAIKKVAAVADKCAEVLK